MQAKLACVAEDKQELQVFSSPTEAKFETKIKCKPKIWFLNVTFKWLNSSQKRQSDVSTSEASIKFVCVGLPTAVHAMSPHFSTRLGLLFWGS